MSNTLCIMRLMDDARAQLGVIYDSVRRFSPPAPRAQIAHTPSVRPRLSCCGVPTPVQDAASITVGQAAKM